MLDLQKYLPDSQFLRVNILVGLTLENFDNSFENHGSKLGNDQFNQVLRIVQVHSRGSNCAFNDLEKKK